MSCRICGQSDDLFLACSSEGVCSVCKLKFVGGLNATEETIQKIRSSLGLKTGEFFLQDCGAEAKRILGR